MKEYFSPIKLAVYTVLFIFILTGCNDTKSTDANDTQELVDSTKIDVSTVDETIVPVAVDNAVKAETLVETMDASKLNPAQMSVQKLLESCVKGNYAEAAKVIMYRGGDESRIGQDSFNYQNENEAKTVKVTCEVITAWLGASKSYEFISYQEEETEFGMQNVVEIMFKKEKLGVERHFFYLMKTPKGMMLVNMI